MTAHKAAYPTTKARSAVIQVISFDGMLEAMDADDVTTISGRFDSRGVAIASVPIAWIPVGRLRLRCALDRNRDRGAGHRRLRERTGAYRPVLRMHRPGSEAGK